MQMTCRKGEVLVHIFVTLQGSLEEQHNSENHRFGKTRTADVSQPDNGRFVTEKPTAQPEITYQNQQQNDNKSV